MDQNIFKRFVREKHGNRSDLSNSTDHSSFEKAKLLNTFQLFPLFFKIY